MKLFKKKEVVPITGLVGEAQDYNIHQVSSKERVVWFVVGMLVSAAVLYVFYERWYISLIVGAICGACFITIRRDQVIEKRKKALTLQFRSLLDTLSTSIGAGKNMFEAFDGAADDLTVQFTEDSDIVREVNIIRSGLYNNIQIEDLLLNFAERSGLEDIRNFANVFATCYKKGGNIKDVIKNTASIIGDKIEVQMEVDTMVAGQKNQQNIMLVMPVVFILVLKSMGGELIDLSSPIGVLSVSIALVIFVLAYFLSKRILKIDL